MKSKNLEMYSLMELKFVARPGGRAWTGFRYGWGWGGACVDFLRMLEMSIDRWRWYQWRTMRSSFPL